MKEENQLTEYKEQKGIFQWLKSKFEKLKEVFSGKRNSEKVQTTHDLYEDELSEEELDKVKGGVPIPAKVVDEEELMANLGVTEPKSWELTEDELEQVTAQPYKDELTEDELDDVKGGQPIIDEER